VPNVGDSQYLVHSMTSRVSRVAMDNAEKAVNNGLVYGEIADPANPDPAQVAQRDQLCSNCHGGNNLLPAVSCGQSWNNHLIQGRVSETVWEDVSAPLGGCGW
jgi:hypothetical protein